MSSTGTVLASISPMSRENVLRLMRQNGITATLLGHFTKDKRRIVVKNGRETNFPRKDKDPYERILSEEDSDTV
jgi:hydrogenase maturation factor